MLNNNYNNNFFTIEVIDKDWIVELVKYSSNIIDKGLTEKDKKLLIKYFLDYKNEGFNSSAAMKKAIIVFDILDSWNY